MKDPQPTNRLLLIAAIILFFLLSWPVWQWLWNEWIHNEYYSHGLLIPLVAGFLAIQRIRLRRPLDAAASPSGSPQVPTVVTTTLGWLWFAASLILYIFFVNESAYYLAAFCLVALIAGLVWLFGGKFLLREWSFPIAYLLLMIPLPFVERATYPLAIFAGICGGGLMQWLGMELSIVGNAVTLPNADLVIGAQCSGINSLIALSALMILAAYILDGALWGRLILVLLAVPLAIFGNILRIASLLFVARTYGVESAFTFYHDYSGVLFFLVVLLFMFPLVRLLQINKLRLDVI
ncbi:MAG: exosortase/archaeosortase family protein [Caldilineaceae bacterium]|nr:exosortase/archaeosortase family protein [Caldilineaceae bacterium]